MIHPRGIIVCFEYKLNVHSVHSTLVYQFAKAGGRFDRGGKRVLGPWEGGGGGFDPWEGGCVE
jgi:hypothetical protein